MNATIKLATVALAALALAGCASAPASPTTPGARQTANEVFWEMIDDPDIDESNASVREAAEELATVTCEALKDGSPAEAVMDVSTVKYPDETRMIQLAGVKAYCPEFFDAAALTR